MVADELAVEPRVGAAAVEAETLDVSAGLKLRRALAFGLDLWTTIVIAQLGAAPISLLAPPDSFGPATLSTVCGALLGFGYWAFSPLLFGNTLGKSVFGLRLVSADDTPLSAARSLARILTIGAWPLLAVMVIATRSGRHLGDRWARTRVVALERPRNLWLAWLAALMIAIVGQQLAKLSMRVAVLRSDAWATARQHLSGRGELSWLPVGYHIRNASAVFSLRAGEQLQRVFLYRDEAAAWKATTSEAIAEDDGSMSIRFGADATDPGPVAAVSFGGDASGQRQLSAAEEQRGDALKAAGKLAEAQAAYARSVAITQQLVAASPDQAELLRELSIGYERLGELAKQRADHVAAREAFEKALALAKRVAAAAPSQPQLQRDLSISYEKVGDVCVLEGRSVDARAAYEASLEISKQLSAQLPDNLDLQRDLSVSYNKLGDVLWTDNAFVPARELFQSAFVIRQRLVAARPGAEAARDLEKSHERLARATLQAGDVPAARAHAQKALELAQRLDEANPDRVELMFELAQANAKLAWVERSAGDKEVGRAPNARAIELLRKLIARVPDDPAFARLLAELEQY